jgi:hypothetical protein
VLERVRVLVSGEQNLRILQELVPDHVADGVVLLKMELS